MQQRIGLLSDAEFSDRPGGAARLVDRATARVPGGVDVIPCPPGAVDRDCDGYVLFSTKRYSADEYAFILERPYVRAEWDYWRNAEPGAPWRDRLNEHARLVLFCSALHRQVYRTYHRSLGCPTEIVAPPLDPAPFATVREAATERAGAVWFGEWQWFKGPDIAMRWAGESRTVTDFYSPNLPPTQHAANGYSRLLGYAPDEGWWQRIAQHETFIHFPRQPEPWPYSLQEAYLLGCQIEIAGRFGIEDVGLEDSVRASAESRFWEVALDALS
jgi:hypothetical protein